MTRRFDPIILWQIAVGVLLLAGWEFVGRVSGGTWTSRPSLIAAKLAVWFQGSIYPDIATTLTEVVTGLVAGTLLGVLAGLLLGRSPITAGILRPIVVAFYSVPLIALAPLFIMFFGLDMLPKIVLVTIVVFFLLFFNTFAGASSVDRELIAQVQLMGSTRREKFQKVVAPASMAWIIGGIRTALPYALVAATTGEMLAARRGLGFLLSDAASQFDMTSLYAALFILMLLGLGGRRDRHLGRAAHAAVASCRGVTSPRRSVWPASARRFVTRDREVEALQPIDLTIQDHEFVALVGPSGCGKSTILNLIAGLLQPNSGVVSYDGVAVGGLNRAVGYMTQKDTLLPWRTAADNIRIALELKCRAVPRAEAEARVAQMIGLVGLSGFERHYPAELSGGMRKRVALARTLIYEPETLLMDEPFGALDAQLKLLMLDQLQELTRQRHMTVVFVTHDLGEAITLADRVVVFSARPGRIRTIRTVDMPRPRDVFRIRFTEDFSHLHEALWDELKDEVTRGTDV